MNKGITEWLVLAVCWVILAPAAQAEEDIFKGKLFAPDVILENQSELDLSEQQRAEIRTAVVAVRSGIAEHEWDMREAYQSLMSELDETPIDHEKVVEYAMTAMMAENQVKAKHLTMLVKLRNLLTARQLEYLEKATR